MSYPREPRLSVVEDLHFQDVGSGPPVLLLHGIGASCRIFNEMISLHADQARCLAVDLPGSGKSVLKGALDPRELAKLLTRFLDSLGVDRFSVVGHSFGGVVACELAAEQPSRVEALVVASAPALGLPAMARQLVEHPVSAFAVRALTRLPHVPALVRRYMALLWGEPEKITEAHVQLYLEAVRSEGFYPAVLKGLRGLARYRLPTAALVAAKIPTAVLWGDSDRLLPLSDGEEIARALGVPLTVLERIGHCVPEERPEAVVSALASLRARPEVPV